MQDKRCPESKSRYTFTVSSAPAPPRQAAHAQPPKDHDSAHTYPARTHAQPMPVCVPRPTKVPTQGIKKVDIEDG